jgi:hypothetical protein
VVDETDVVVLETVVVVEDTVVVDIDVVVVVVLAVVLETLVLVDVTDVVVVERVVVERVVVVVRVRVVVISQALHETGQSNCTEGPNIGSVQNGIKPAHSSGSTTSWHKGNATMMQESHLTGQSCFRFPPKIECVQYAAG